MMASLCLAGSAEWRPDMSAFANPVVDPSVMNILYGFGQITPPFALQSNESPPFVLCPNHGTRPSIGRLK